MNVNVSRGSEAIFDRDIEVGDGNGSKCNVVRPWVSVLTIIIQHLRLSLFSIEAAAHASP